MAQLPLEEAIPRYKQNEERVDTFVNGGPSETYTTSGGQQVPTIRKVIGDLAVSANFYDTIAAGRAAVPNGQSFGVRPGGPDNLDRATIYRRDSATTQTVITSLAPGSEIDTLNNTVVSLTGRANDADAAIDSLGNAVVSLTGRATDADAAIDSLGNAVVSLTGRATDADDAIDSLGDAVGVVTEQLRHTVSAQAGFDPVTVVAFVTQLDGSVIGRLVMNVDNTVSFYAGNDKLAASRELSAAVTDINAKLNSRGTVTLGGTTNPDFVWALTSEMDGSVLLGVQTDGRLFFDGRTSGYSALVMDQEGYLVTPQNRIAKATARGSVKADRTLSDLPVVGVSLDGQYVKLVERRDALYRRVSTNAAPQLVVADGTLRVRREKIAITPFAKSGVSKIVCYIVYGQSLAGGSFPLLTAEPVDTGRALMFTNGPKLPTEGMSNTPPDWFDFGGNVDFEKSIEDVSDLRETRNETCTSGIAKTMLAAPSPFPASEALFMINLANGGIDFRNLIWPINPLDLTEADPTDPDRTFTSSGYRFEQVIRAVKALRFKCETLGYQLEIGGTTLIHGEADGGVGQRYLDFLLMYQPRLNQRLKRITGQTKDIPLFEDQTAYKPEQGSSVSYTQLQASQQNPMIYCNGPKYMIPRLNSEGGSDGTHLTAAGYRWLGAYYGRTMRRDRAGQKVPPLHVVSAVRSGTSIVLTFAGNDSPLTFDTSIVSAVENRGIQWTQSGGVAAQISNVAITAANQITVTLSANPGATTTVERIWIASNAPEQEGMMGPDFGPRSNIRDQSADRGPNGETLYNWACHQLINLK